MDHDAPWTLAGHSNEAFHEYGGWGVFLFFVISGFLVCGRMLADEHKYGQVRLKAFYIRRFCRIQPAALVYLGVVALLVLLGISHERWFRIGAALIGFLNCIFSSADVCDPTASWYLSGHFWTLGVEEQFYLRLSILLFSIRRYRALALALLFIGIRAYQRLTIHVGITNVIKRPPISR